MECSADWECTASSCFICRIIAAQIHPTGCSVSRFRCVEFGVCWRGDIARNAKQGAECVERVETAVEAKRELIEIRL